ncbi:MAG: aminotransferase class IV [Bacteroidales bacterium]|nr:aminotransferase class IV [Bacteroidales bacterium]
MLPLIETIRAEKGRLMHSSFHNDRMNESASKLYGRSFSFDVDAVFSDLIPFDGMIYRCRITYSDRIIKSELFPYQKKPIRSLQIVNANRLEYRFKFEDRTEINALFDLKEKADDILIVKNGLITDSSMANLIIFDGKRYYTPAIPILHGTCRARLLSENKIIPIDIKPGDLAHLESFTLINAMRDFDPTDFNPIKNINIPIIFK